jgi:hypothetical protein
MSNKHQSSSSDASNEASKSPIELLVARYGLMGTIVTALIGLLGIAITAYFTYLATRTQIIGPIEATQTAEARRDIPIQNTSIEPTDTLATPPSVTEVTIQPTYTTIVDLTEPPILTPVLTHTSASTSQALVCITTQKGVEGPVEILADSFSNSVYDYLPLANGVNVPFSSMKSFEVQSLENGQLMVTITLLGGDTLTEPAATGGPIILMGLTTRGFSYKMWLSDVKRVEFRPEGRCQ